jgi:hypothetical protein
MEIKVKTKKHLLHKNNKPTNIINVVKNSEEIKNLKIIRG